MREPCHIEGCEKPSRGHGLCATHWARCGQTSIQVVGETGEIVGQIEIQS